jgi:hypothetical protein
LGWLSYRGYERRTRESRHEPATAAASAPAALATPGMIRPVDDDDERPSRLN